MNVTIAKTIRFNLLRVGGIKTRPASQAADTGIREQPEKNVANHKITDPAKTETVSTFQKMKQRNKLDLEKRDKMEPTEKEGKL